MSTLFLACRTPSREPSTSTPSLSPATSAPISLKLEQPVERELSDGDTHRYLVEAPAGQFLRVVVEQRGIDVKVLLHTPDGDEPFEMDSPNGSEGPEPISLVTKVQGEYVIEVSPSKKKAPKGIYQAKLVALRPPVRQDLVLIHGEREDAAAEKLVHHPDSQQPSIQRQVIEHYAIALKCWRELREHNREAWTLSRLGQLYALSAEPRKALKFYQEALPIWRELANRNREARMLNEVGFVYNRIGEKRTALRFYEQALPLFSDEAAKATTFRNIGAAYADLSEMQKALAAYNQSFSLVASQDELRKADILNFIGQVYALSGAPQEIYHHEALKIFQRHDDTIGIADTLNYLGIARWTDGTYLLSTGSPEQVRAYQEAEKFYNEALPLWQQAEERNGEANTRHNLGRLYDSQGKWQEALTQFEHARQLLSEANDRMLEGTLLNNLGFVNVHLGNWQQAMKYHRSALRLSRQLGDQMLEARACYGIALLERASGRLVPARSQIEKTIHIVEHLRADLTSPEMRLTYRAKVQEYYELYIDLLMRLGNKQSALQVSERARARALLESFTESRAEIQSGVSPELLARKHELQQLLNDKAAVRVKLLSNPRTEVQADTLRKEMDALSRSLQQVQTQIRQTYPRYSALTQPQPLKLAEIQKVLDTNTLLLEYALGEERSYLWAVTFGKIESYELPRRHEIEDLARSSHEFLSIASNQVTGQRLLTQPRQTFPQANSEVMKKLSQMVLGKVAIQLGKKRLVIVADGALHYVPFGALLDPNAGDGIEQPLLAQHEVVNLPSASVLSELRRELARRKVAPQSIAWVVDPVFSAEDERVKSRLQQPKNQNYPTIESITNKPVAR